MKCILLCAGYATRLFPLTKNFPKALLTVGKKRILDYIVEDLETIPEIDGVYIITNAKYYNHFVDFVDSIKTSKTYTVINDHTTSNDDRLGAIGDILYTIKKQNINEDILVMASDSMYTFKLRDFVDFYKEYGKACVTLKISNDIEELRRFAVTCINEDNTIVDFVEKPQNPKSNLAACAFYIYTKEQIPLFSEYIEEGNNKDAPGNFIEYLYKKEEVKGYIFDGQYFDIGTHESLKEMNERYS